MTKNQFTEPDKTLENLFAQYITGPINESVEQKEGAVPTDEEDDIDLLDNDFEKLYESIMAEPKKGKVITESADTQFEDDEEFGDLPQEDDGIPDLSEFDSVEGEEGEFGDEGEGETVSIPVEQLRGLYDILAGYFGGEGEGDEDLSEFEDVLPSEETPETEGDEIPMESCKLNGKKLLDSKKTPFKSNANVKKPVNKAVVHDKRPKKFDIKAKGKKLTKKSQ